MMEGRKRMIWGGENSGRDIRKVLGREKRGIGEARGRKNREEEGGGRRRRRGLREGKNRRGRRGQKAVSYTHLTLPTIYSV